MIWRRILLLSSIFLLVLAVRVFVLACASGWESEYSRIFFFLPENGNSIGDKWWFRQTNSSYYNGDETIRLDTTVILSEDVKQLCEEWNTLLGTHFPIQDVADAVFYKSVLLDKEVVLIEAAKPSALKVLEAFRKHKEFYEYLMIAKELENFSVDPYEVTEKQLKEYAAQYKNLQLKLARQAELARGNKALHEKYLYQLLKLGTSYNEYALFESNYETFKKINISPTLQGWGTLYYVNATFYTDDLEKIKASNLLLAEVMRLSPGKTPRCVELFKAQQNPSYINEVQDSVLKANLLSMQAMYDFRPQMDNIAEVAVLHPSNVLLSELLTREINKYEDYKFSKKYTGFVVLGTSSEKEKYESSFKALIAVLSKLSDNKLLDLNCRNYFTLALAHCKALAGEEKEALELLGKVTTDFLPHKIQKLISELFILSGRDLSDDQNLDRIAAKMIEIYTMGKGAENVKRCLSSVMLKIHQRLLGKNEVALAGLCLLRSNMALVTDNYYTNNTWYELNATHADFLALEKILLKKEKSTLEKLLVTNLDINTVYNSRAKVYLRESNLDSAVVYLRKLPEWYYAKKYNFLVETSVFFKEEKKPNKNMEVIEALTLLSDRMKQAEKIEDKNKKASEYLAIANAFFELSNRGQYCYTTAYYSTGYGPQSVKAIKARRPEALYSFYFQAEPAFRYFAQAKELSSDPELSAAIQYWYMRAFDDVYQSTHSKEIPVEGWVDYFTLYGNTDFYRLHSCPGIEEYKGRDL